MRRANMMEKARRDIQRLPAPAEFEYRMIVDDWQLKIEGVTVILIGLRKQ